MNLLFRLLLGKRMHQPWDDRRTDALDDIVKKDNEELDKKLKKKWGIEDD